MEARRPGHDGKLPFPMRLAPGTVSGANGCKPVATQSRKGKTMTTFEEARRIVSGSPVPPRFRGNKRAFFKAIRLDLMTQEMWRVWIRFNERRRRDKAFNDACVASGLADFR